MIVKVSAEGSFWSSDGQMDTSGSCWAPGRALSSLHRLLLLPAKNQHPALPRPVLWTRSGKAGEVTKLAHEYGVCVARPCQTSHGWGGGGSSPTLQTHGGFIT